MDKIYFATVSIHGSNENNQLFYLSEEDAKKDIDHKINEEINNVCKLIHDYSLDTPILNSILKNLKIDIATRVFTLEKKAS